MVMALLTAAFDDVVRARTKLRGQPRYTLEELLAKCDPNATSPGEMDWGSDIGHEAGQACSNVKS